jgi:hypothetical protein
MRSKTLQVLVLGLSMWLLGGLPSASAAPTDDRPTNVAAVQAVPLVLLHPDGSLTASAVLRCIPGWTPAELSATVNQGNASASGYTTPTIRCDNRWHPVVYRITDSTGGFTQGKVTFNFLQFTLTNNVTGDSAGAHAAPFSPAYLLPVRR